MCNPVIMISPAQHRHTLWHIREMEVISIHLAGTVWLITLRGRQIIIHPTTLAPSVRHSGVTEQDDDSQMLSNDFLLSSFFLLL